MNKRKSKLIFKMPNTKTKIVKKIIIIKLYKKIYNK